MHEKSWGGAEAVAFVSQNQFGKHTYYIWEEKKGHIYG